jgi:hypothetical protein
MAEPANPDGELGARIERVVNALLLPVALSSTDSTESTRALDETNIPDVRHEVAKFNYAYEICRELHEGFPCVGMGDFGLIPFDFLNHRYLYPYRYPYPFLQSPKYLKQSLREMVGEGTAVEVVEPEEARGLVRKALTRFLGSRFAPPHPSAVHSHVPFTLHNVNPKLQMYYSSPYYFSTSNVFGGPSTPVTSMIRPGIWVFGGMGAATGYKHSFETGSHFDIPRVHTSGTLVTV